MDFDRGDLLYLTGTAEVIWEGVEIELYEGAERLLRFHLDRGSEIRYFHVQSETIAQVFLHV